MDRPPGDDELTETLERSQRPFHSRSRALDLDSLPRRARQASRLRWTTPDGLEIVGGGRATRFRADEDRFETVRETASEWFGRLSYVGPEIARPRALGGVAFHESHEPDGVWDGFAGASFLVPERQLVATEDGVWVTVTTPSETETNDRLEELSNRLENESVPARDGTSSVRASEPPGVATTRRSTTIDAWSEQVESALERIRDGELTKVVLAQSLTADLEEPIDVPAAVERLGRTYPDCYRFAIRQESGAAFFGAPPERLVSKRGRTVETEALAGSIQRGETAETDEAFATQLRESDKLQHEHELVVETIRDQLESRSETVTVAEQRIRKLATIQHLWTPISATLEPDCHVLEIVEALHPTPAVGGVPLDDALETIRSTERFDRGWYAAPVGWFDGNGDGEFAVGLRSAVADDRTAVLFAGNGIVADSDPREEWEEVQLKFKPILEVLG